MRAPVPVKASPVRALTARVLRDSMPLNDYLGILNILAMTGKIPVYEPAGPRHPPVFTGEYQELDRSLQIDVLKTLVKAAFDAIPKDLPPPAIDLLATLAANPDRLRSLSISDIAGALQNAANEPANA